MAFFGPRDTQAVNSFNRTVNEFVDKRQVEQLKDEINQVGTIVYQYLSSASPEQLQDPNFMGNIVKELKSKGFSTQALSAGVNLAAGYAQQYQANIVHAQNTDRFNREKEQYLQARNEDAELKATQQRIANEKGYASWIELETTLGADRAQQLLSNSRLDGKYKQSQIDLKGAQIRALNTPKQPVFNNGKSLTLYKDGRSVPVNSQQEYDQYTSQGWTKETPQSKQYVDIQKERAINNLRLLATRFGGLYSPESGELRIPLGSLNDKNYSVEKKRDYIIEELKKSGFTFDIQELVDKNLIRADKGSLVIKTGAFIPGQSHISEGEKQKQKELLNLLISSNVKQNASVEPNALVEQSASVEQEQSLTAQDALEDAILGLKEYVKTENPGNPGNPELQQEIVLTLDDKIKHGQPLKFEDETVLGALQELRNPGEHIQVLNSPGTSTLQRLQKEASSLPRPNKLPEASKVLALVAPQQQQPLPQQQQIIQQYKQLNPAKQAQIQEEILRKMQTEQQLSPEEEILWRAIAAGRV